MKTKTTYSIGVVFTTIALLFSIQSHSQVVLYGLTSIGGVYGDGTVFSVNSSGQLDTIVSLNYTYAAIPEGSLLYASDGNFYASSFEGGYADSCTIFRCTPTGVLTTMINLDSVFWGESAPEGNSLIQALDSNLYCMITNGGPSNEGVILRLKLSGKYDTIHCFSGQDGSAPHGSLIQTPDSMLWGMTSAGGDSGVGNIFHYTTSGGLTSVFSFGTFDGTYPYGDIVLATDGNFYGLTSAGGKYGYGTLFRYSPSGAFTKLVDFDDSNGAYPYGSLIQASDSNLYGLTENGGRFSDGTLFICTLSGNLTTLVNFDDTNGADPLGTLLQASDGNLYGMTSYGGKYQNGVIFKYSLSGNLDTLVSFNGTNGESPEYGALIEIPSKTDDIKQISDANTTEVYPNPSNGIFTIAFNHPESQPIFEIYNVLGEKIYSQSTGHSSLFTINLNSQPNGVYFYRVISENGELIGEGKLIIEK